MVVVIFHNQQVHQQLPLLEEFITYDLPLKMYSALRRVDHQHQLLMLHHPGRSVRTGFGRKTREMTGTWKQEYDVRIRWPVFPVSRENQPEPNITGHRIRAPYSCFQIRPFSDGFRQEPAGESPVPAGKSLEPASGIIDLGTESNLMVHSIG